MLRRPKQRLGRDPLGVDSVRGIDVHHDGGVAGQLIVRVARVRDDDDLVPRVDETCGGAVEADLARSGCSFDHVGLEARPIVDVDHMDLLEFEEVSSLHQVTVEGDRADVGEIRIRNGCSMDLGLHHRSVHGYQLQSR